MYALRPGLHLTVSNERPVFLDLREDRYFSLPRELEIPFLNLIRGGPAAAPTEAERRLLDTGILAVAGELPAWLPAEIRPATRSLVEETSTAGAPAAHVGVAAAVARAWIEEKALSLAARIARLRRRKREFQSCLATHDDMEEMEKHATAFHRHRPFIPIARSCLRDSAALIDYLARRQCFPNLVIGVAMDPFAAHCWVQAGELLLNDELGHAARFSPILAV